MKDLWKVTDALIRKGKVCGQVTHDEIIDALSGFSVSPDTFDVILERFLTEGVEVVDNWEGDDKDDVTLVRGESSPVKPEPRSIGFDVSARELLKWATQIALTRDAEEVDSAHVVAAAQAQSSPPEPRRIWDIPFSPDLQSVLARACSGMSPISRRHILKAVSLRYY